MPDSAERVLRSRPWRRTQVVCPPAPPYVVTHGQNPFWGQSLASAAVETGPHRYRYPAGGLRPPGVPAGARLLDDPPRPPRALRRYTRRAPLAPPASGVVAPGPENRGTG